MLFRSHWLKYWPGERALLGIVVIPAILAVLFLGLPFLDRGAERRPTRRPLTMGGFALVLLGLCGLGLASSSNDSRDPAIAKQLTVQREAVRAFMEAPFEPEESAGSLRTSKAALADPQVARGKKIFGDQSCDACHGPDGRGTETAPTLVGTVTKYPGDELARVLRKPTTKMSDGGMQALNDLADADLAALVAYVSGLK